MNIVILAGCDYANAGRYIAAAIRDCTPHFCACVTRTQHGYGYLRDMAKDEATEIVAAADVVITKDDQIIPERLGYHVRDAIRIATVEGIEYRNCRAEQAPFLKQVDATVAIHADMAYPEIDDFIPVAYEDLGCRWEPKRRPVVAHSPSGNRHLKGTDNLFLPAMELLRRRGYQFDVDLICGVSFAECMARKAEATIFFDQAHAGLGGYGFSAIEAMTYGIPTVAYIAKDVVSRGGSFFNGCPVFNVEPTVESLADAIGDLLACELTGVSRETRAWALAAHGFQSVSSRWMDLLERML